MTTIDALYPTAAAKVQETKAAKEQYQRAQTTDHIIRSMLNAEAERFTTWPQPLTLYRWEWNIGGAQDDEGFTHCEYDKGYSHQCELQDGWVTFLDKGRVKLDQAAHRPVITELMIATVEDAKRHDLTQPVYVTVKGASVTAMEFPPLLFDHDYLWNWSEYSGSYEIAMPKPWLRSVLGLPEQPSIELTLPETPDLETLITQYRSPPKSRSFLC